METNSVPALTLHCEPAGPAFPISPECEMPEIVVTAQISPAPLQPLQYDWTVSLAFTGTACTHSVGREMDREDIRHTSAANTFTIPFPRVRGGDLAIGVSVAVGGTVLRASTDGLQVTGTNPAVAALRVAVPANDGFRKLIRLESALRQFRTPSCPLFSEDNQGGVGICQITTPAPTGDQVWSWKENLRAGWQFYLSKQSLAKGYPARVRTSLEFQALLKAFHARREAAALAPIAVVVPEFTEEQLQRDTLRAYNGFAGNLHEYRLKLDNEGLLAVTMNGSTATAQWEAISPAERSALCERMGLPIHRRGDVNYVEDVLKQPTF